MTWHTEALRSAVRLFRSDDPSETKIAVGLMAMVAGAFAYHTFLKGPRERQTTTR
jgi:hypothetical protein